MIELDQKRKEWNSRQKVLRGALEKPVDFDRTIQMYLDHHAMLHDPAVGGEGIWSFDKALWEGLSDGAARQIPVKFEHSIVWLVWHLARCEDAAFNIAVNNGRQVLIEGNWTERMGITASDSGNAMGEAEILDLSRDIEIASLRAYRMAVGQRTREIVKNLQSRISSVLVDLPPWSATTRKQLFWNLPGILPNSGRNPRSQD